MFERIVCGVDGSEASLEGVRQADVLLADGGRLVLVSAVDLTDAIHFQIAPTAVHAARRALEKAPSAKAAVVNGVALFGDYFVLQSHGCHTSASGRERTAS